MAELVSFQRTFATFGPDVHGVEKSAPVAELIAGIMAKWHYPIDAFIGARVTAEQLFAAPTCRTDHDDLDLIFELRGQCYNEVILRDQDHMPVYGGWLIQGRHLVIADEVVNGYRVLVSDLGDGGRIRHYFTPETGYAPMVGTQTLPRMVEQRLQLIEIERNWRREA